MFTVYDKKTRQEVKVLRVRDDKNGYPQFLVEIGNEWVYRSAKHYTLRYICQGLIQRWKEDGCLGESN